MGLNCAHVVIIPHDFHATTTGATGINVVLEDEFLEIRYANKALELAKGKTAIVIPTKDKIVSTIELAIQAVEEKELDSSIAKIAEEKKKGFSKAV